MTLNTIALELVPPNLDRHRAGSRRRPQSGAAGGEIRDRRPDRARDDARDDRRRRRPADRDEAEARRAGFLVDDRARAAGVRGLCNQVTAFMDEPACVNGSVIWSTPGSKESCSSAYRAR